MICLSVKYVEAATFAYPSLNFLGSMLLITEAILALVSIKNAVKKRKGWIATIISGVMIIAGGILWVITIY